jgi:hypothetical protein
MTLNSSSLIQRLQELQQQIADATLCGASLQEAQHRQDRQAFLYASIDAERHVDRMAVTTGDIKAQVVPADDLGHEPESLSELVLRAVRIVLLAELSALRDAVSERSARDRSRALFQGPFRSIDELTSSMRDELIRITDRWRAYRGMQRVDLVSYRAALRAAHASMRELDIGSEVAHFLRAGLTCTDWPALQKVCARMVAASMAIRIDVDPVLPLVCSRPLPEVAAEQAP